MVWRTVRGVLVENAWNYSCLGALAGIDVHLSKELQWFDEPYSSNVQLEDVTHCSGALLG